MIDVGAHAKEPHLKHRCFDWRNNNPEVRLHASRILVGRIGPHKRSRLPAPPLAPARPRTQDSSRHGDFPLLICGRRVH